MKREKKNQSYGILSNIGFLEAHFETCTKQKVLLASFISNSMPRKTHLSFRIIIRGYILCFSYSGKKIHHPLLFCKTFPSVPPNSYRYEILRTLWNTAVMYSFLFYISNFWADAISEWGKKHTGLLFLREKLKIINIADHI